MHHTTIDRSAVRDAWRARGFTCDLWVDPPGQIWADFVHDVDEVLLVVSGTLVVEMDGHTVRLEPGQEVLITAGTRHTVRNVDDGASRWLYGYRQAA